MCNRLDTIPACDRRTDGRLATAQSALCIRGKNEKIHWTDYSVKKLYWCIFIRQMTPQLTVSIEHRNYATFQSAIVTITAAGYANGPPLLALPRLSRLFQNFQHTYKKLHRQKIREQQGQFVFQDYLFQKANVLHEILQCNCCFAVMFTLKQFSLCSMTRKLQQHKHKTHHIFQRID